MANIKKISSSHDNNTIKGIKKLSGAGSGDEVLDRVKCASQTNDNCVYNNSGDCQTYNFCGHNNVGGGCASTNICWWDNSKCATAVVDFCEYQDNFTCMHKTGDICSSSVGDAKYCTGTPDVTDSCGGGDYCDGFQADVNCLLNNNEQNCTNLVNNIPNLCSDPSTNNGIGCPTNICYNGTSDSACPSD